ncbi:hypothetical protein AB0B25_20765 [Nocardia sp. NPDC049190]|uniref:hypothetical protein n=1 Tax=Nocardia sp. NPDC049190 TaxID=3155650 RepID=UPI00340E47EF
MPDAALIVAEGDRDHFYGLLIEHLDKAQCRTLLTDTDPQVRTRVCWVTSWDRRNRGPVDVALDVLADDRFDYAWPECIEVLRRPIEFNLLVGALVDAPSEGLSERLLVTLGLPAATRILSSLPSCPLHRSAAHFGSGVAKSLPHTDANTCPFSLRYWAVRSERSGTRRCGS